MKLLIFIGTCFVGGIFIICVLYFTTPQRKPQDKNGFQREILSNVISNRKEFDLKSNSYYLAGLSEKYIYLGDKRRSDTYLSISYQLIDTQRVDLKIPKLDTLQLENARLVINEPQIFVYENKPPQLLHGTIPIFKYSFSNLDNQWFAKMMPIDSNKMVVSTYEPNLEQDILKLITLDATIQRDTFPTFVLDKQVDGVFCVDGFFVYDRTLRQILYVYFHRNRFVGLDTDFKLLYYGSTIDTVSRPNIQVRTISSENKRTLINRPTAINKRASTDGVRLYIHSGLKADNESIEDFQANDVIDVYSLTDQSYLYSFYLPRLSHKRIHEYKIHRNKLIIIYRNILMTYDLKELNRLDLI